AVLDVIGEPGFLAAVTQRGDQLAAGLRDLGLGRRVAVLMVGFDLPGAQDVARGARLEQRLVVHATGPTTIRMLPPLTVAAEEINDAARRLGGALGSAS